MSDQSLCSASLSLRMSLTRAIRWLQAVGPLEIPVADFVLFRVEIFFAAVAHGAMLHQLEGGAVDAVVRAQRGGQQQADGEDGAAADLQKLGENVGRVGPLVGAEEVAHRRLGQLGEVGGDFGLGVAPREVSVGLAESQLGEAVHDLGAREGFGQKEDFRVVALDFGDDPLPEGKGLGVRVVDAEDGDALVDPVEEDALQLLPHAGPVFALKVEGVDVLVLLGRIFGVLDGAVGALAEPGLVLAHIGMIGRGLEGDVERQGQVEIFDLGDEAAEVVEGAELRNGCSCGRPRPSRWPRGCRNRRAGLRG